VPQETLSFSLAGGRSSVVCGDVKDLSEVGARVLAPAALDHAREVTIDVHSGYTLLFRAEGRIVWRTLVDSRPDARVSLCGIFFTALSPFSRKLIRRLGGFPAAREAGADFDSDLEVFFPRSGSREDAFDLLSDADFERPLFDESAEAEISGNLGYFNNTDVLQMLEAARATGVLYVEGEDAGQIHLQDGRICGCFSATLDEYEAVFRLIVADRGRFRFIPSGVRSNLFASRTTAQLLLEAQLRLDLDRRASRDR
jgi:hypothetical protein